LGRVLVNLGILHCLKDGLLLDVQAGLLEVVVQRSAPAHEEVFAVLHTREQRGATAHVAWAAATEKFLEAEEVARSHVDCLTTM